MYSYPTLHEVSAAADYYWQVWQQLLAKTKGLRQVVGQHSPVALGWKVEGDLAPLEAATRLFELGDSIYAGPVSDRTIATVRKARAVALDTLQEIEVIQRRAARPDDALGPDCLLLLLPHGVPALEDVRKILHDNSEAFVEAERNESHSWLSITYMGREFKLQTETVWQICAREAGELSA